MAGPATQTSNKRGLHKKNKASTPQSSFSFGVTYFKPIMRRVKRFVASSSQERRLLLRAFFLVGLVRAGLCVLPFRIVQGLTGKVNAAKTFHPVGRCVWAVRAVSRFVPGATCLTQALAAQALLAQSGHNSRIEIGVTKDAQRRFRAHAWVACGEEVVIGGAEVDRYVPLAAWNTNIGRTN